VKTPFALILFFALLLKMGGFYAILSYEKYEIREKVAQKLIKSLKKSELICIAANAKNLPRMRWEHLGKEFEFEGSLYDVAFFETISGINYYYCLKDNEETKLALKFNQLINNQTDDMPIGDNAKLILYLLAQPLFAQPNPSFHFSYLPDKKPFIVIPSLIFYASDFVSKLEQPPQFP